MTTWTYLRRTEEMLQRNADIARRNPWMFGDPTGVINQAERMAAANRSISAAKWDLSNYEETLSLIEAIRESGGDVEEMLFGKVRLMPEGIGAGQMGNILLSTVDRAEIIGKIVDKLNAKTRASILVATQGFDKQIDQMRSWREEVSSLEARFAHAHFTQLGNYQEEVADLDKKIAEAEGDVLATGSQNSMMTLINFEAQRTTLMKNMEDFFLQVRELDKKMGDIRFIGEGAGADQAEAFKHDLLEPDRKGHPGRADAQYQPGAMAQNLRATHRNFESLHRPDEGC